LVSGVPASAQSGLEHPNCASNTASGLKLNVYGVDGQKLSSVDKVEDISDVTVKGCYPEEDDNAGSLGILVGYEDFPKDDDPRYYYGERTGYTSLYSYSYNLNGNNFVCTSDDCDIEKLDLSIDRDIGNYDSFTFEFIEGKENDQSDVVYHLTLVALDKDSLSDNLPATLDLLTEDGLNYYCDRGEVSNPELYTLDSGDYDCVASDHMHITEVQGELEDEDSGEESEEDEEDSSEEGADLSKLSFIPSGTWIDICQRESSNSVQITEATEEDLEEENSIAMSMTADCITDFVVPVGTGNIGDSPIRITDIDAGRDLIMSSFCESTVNTETGNIYEWDRTSSQCKESDRSWEDAHEEYVEQSEETEGSEGGDDEESTSDEDTGSEPSESEEINWDVPEEEVQSFTYEGNYFEYAFTEEPEKSFEGDSVAFEAEIKSEDVELGPDYEMTWMRKRPGDWTTGAIRFSGGTAHSNCASSNPDVCQALFEPAEVDTSGMNEGQNLYLGIKFWGADDELITNYEETQKGYTKSLEGSNG
jgi:hypothetical protein